MENTQSSGSEAQNTTPVTQQSAPVSPPPEPAVAPPQSQSPQAAEAPQETIQNQPLWKNPRVIFAAAMALLVIGAGIFFSSYSKGLKGSFDNFDPTVDYKIASFTVTQAADTSMELTYKIEKDAANLFMAITKVAADDKPESDEMVKLIALSDADLKAGEHKITVTADDVKTAFISAGTYRFQVIAYNTSDEITDFKAEKRTVTVDKGKVTLGNK